MSKPCNRRDCRDCAISTLLVFIKLASKMSDESMTEDDILRFGVESLAALGVSGGELFEATLYLTMSPPMSDVENDSAVSTRDGEHSEG